MMAMHNDGNLSAVLLELAKASPARSQTAWVSRFLPEIEAALSQGVRLAAIHQALVDRGLTLSFRGFEKSLYRCRKAVRLGNQVARSGQACLHPALPGASSGDPGGRELPALPAGDVAAQTASHATMRAVDGFMTPSDGDVARGYFDQLRATGRMPAAKTIEDA